MPKPTPEDTAIEQHNLKRTQTLKSIITLIDQLDAECARIAAEIGLQPETFRSYVVGILDARETERKLFTP